MEPNDIAGLLNSVANNCVDNQPIILNNAFLKSKKSVEKEEKVKPVKREPLTTKRAVELLLEGGLKKKVCRYCLNVASPLSELDQVLQIAGTGTMYKISIRDMVACFHPFKVADDPNFPSKICNKCLNRTISSYLFTQQCEQSERALRNCFEDMFTKFNKLDSLEPKLKKRGRQKIYPNFNTLYADHEKVIDYAEPIINIVNSGCELIGDQSEIDPAHPFECLKCLKLFPNMSSLLNHEKSHPKSMYYHCRYCGKSFTKRHLLKKHRSSNHEHGQLPQIVKEDFKCAECGVVSEDYNQHLQHIEKHKFHRVMEHLIEKNMDKLCAVCLDTSSSLVDMEKMVCLHGGYPEMMGDRTLYNILGSTVPEMNILHNYTGTKICEKCLNHAITSYVFIQQTQYVRNRLNTCISLMLDNLNKVQNPEANLFVEISQNTIMPIVEQEFDENLILDEEEIDESKLKVEVLEDEFRLKSESEESESEQVTEPEKKIDIEEDEKSVLRKPETKNVYDDMFELTALSVESDGPLDNPAKKAVKTYKRNICNGIQPHDDKKYNPLNICSEFLTFNKKKKPVKRFYSCKFTCPICNKHFVSDYFLKRHILKHVNQKVECKICENTFKSKFFLSEHVKMCHILKENSYVPCEICGRCFIDPKKMDRHLQTHLTKACQLCNKSFVSQHHYESHMQRHVSKLRLLKQRRSQTCSFCEKECSNDNELSVHVNKVHLQIKPYSCDMCERQFYTESNLNSHKKVHSLFSKESCEFCGKILKCRNDLVIHVRKHIGVQPHACLICSQTFYSSGRVKAHMSSYHGGAFCCKLCKQTFRTKNGLKHHINRAHNII